MRRQPRPAGGRFLADPAQSVAGSHLAGLVDASGSSRLTICGAGVKRVKGGMELERDPGPLARFEEVKADESVPLMVFGRVCEGETLREIAREWRVPRGRFIEWFTTEHAGLYDSALKVRADELAHEALEISDEQNEVVKENGQSFDPDVPRDKLRVDTRLKLAAKWDRKRYGEEVERMVAVPVTIQIGGFRGWKQAAVAEVVEAEQITEVLPSAVTAKDI